MLRDRILKRQEKRGLFSCLPVLLFASFLCLLNGCGGSSTAYDPQTEYQRALVVTSTSPTYDKVSWSLTPVIKENPELIWDRDPSDPQARVLVVTFTRAAYYRNRDLTNYYLPTNAWVTMAPELRNFFRNGFFSVLRLEQLLGLPPNSGNDAIAEIWARPQNLIRPSPDPEITDREAELTFPDNLFRSFASYPKIKDDQDCDANWNLPEQPIQ